MFPRKNSESLRSTFSTPLQNRGAWWPIANLERPQLGTAIGLAIAFVVFLFHVRVYWFLTDDAFIAFRYAVNFAEGNGLVFNVGHERVEGFTSLLWVLIVAFFHFLKVRPEISANLISLFLGIGLWIGVIAFCAQLLERWDSPWLLLVPAFWLAVNRTFAVWTTSGLETRLFTCLIFMSLWLCSDAIRNRRERWWPMALVAGLGVLARPDGLLIASTLFLTRGIWALSTRTLKWKRVLIGILPFLFLVAGQLALRRFSEVPIHTCRSSQFCCLAEFKRLADFVPDAL